MKKLPRVLIVEDESPIAELVAVNLRHNGFQPIWAEDGESAQRELDVLSKAVRDILALALRAFREKDMDAAGQVEPLEQVIDDLKEQMRTRHILRLQQGQCSIETGFVWCDLLTDLERTSDHCSNIAGCVIDAAQHNLNLHETLHAIRHSDENFQRRFRSYLEAYSLPTLPSM